MPTPYPVSVSLVVTPDNARTKRTREEVTTSYVESGRMFRVHRYKFSVKQTRRFNERGDSYVITEDKLYRVTLPNGKQHLVATNQPPEKLAAFFRGERMGTHDRLCDYHFVSPPDQRIRKTRVVSVVHYTSADGKAKHDYSLRATLKPNFWVPRIYTRSVQHDYVVSTEWSRWGRWWVKTTPDFVLTPHGETLLNAETSLRLTDFRASRKYNPFDEPEHSIPRDFRAARIALNEDICARAMRPDRVARMMETYGEDWLDLS